MHGVEFFNILQVLSFLRKLISNTDVFVNQLNYKYTVIILIIFVIITGQSLVNNPMDNCRYVYNHNHLTF